MKKSSTLKIIVFFCLTVLVEVTARMKGTFLVGSHHAFFSAVSISMPMVGIFAGTSMGVLVWLLRAFIRFAVSGIVPSAFLVYHIPSLCAALYWRSSVRILKIIAPIGAMLLFWVHPIGRQAPLYPLYWIIPLYLSLKESESIFLKSLAATFIAHAVGSVLWLYTVPMSGLQWNVLIPVVAIERLLVASGMTLVYHGTTFIFLFRWKRMMNFLVLALQKLTA